MTTCGSLLGIQNARASDRRHCAAIRGFWGRLRRV